MIHLTANRFTDNETKRKEVTAKKLIRFSLASRGICHVMIDESGEVYVYVATSDTPVHIIDVEDK